jgi:hypothetical protein
MEHFAGLDVSVKETSARVLVYSLAFASVLAALVLLLSWYGR